MTTPVIICDDSSLARKQMARALPENWDVEVTFAAHGQEALDAIREGKGEIMFIDLNMPVMDGYETLEVIQKEELPVVSIVVSGDIQPEARERVMQFGALDFIKKPTNKEALEGLLQTYGLYSSGAPVPVEESSGGAAPVAAPAAAPEIPEDKKVTFYDACQEVSNVAMGQAANLLSQLLHCFIEMPIPKVRELEFNELQMALQFAEQEQAISALCQGFIGAGISGEALLIFNDASIQDIAKLMKYEGEIDDSVELELLMDIANVLLGAALKGLADQMDVKFSQGHPVVLGRHCSISELLQDNKRWEKLLTIELDAAVQNHDIHCDLLLLFTEDSLPALRMRMWEVMDL
ncbi:MAG: response regulator [Cellvibrionaceae bacterium]